MGLTQEEIDSFNNNDDNAKKIPTKKQILSKFIEEKFSNIFDIEKAKSDLIKMKSDEEKFKKIIKQIVYENFEIGTVIDNMKLLTLIQENMNRKLELMKSFIKKIIINLKKTTKNQKLFLL